MAITIITEHKLIKIVEGDNQRRLTPLDDVSKENDEIKIVMGGDDNVSQMVLVPIDKIFKD